MNDTQHGNKETQVESQLFSLLYYGQEIGFMYQNLSCPNVEIHVFIDDTTSEHVATIVRSDYQTDSEFYRQAVNVCRRYRRRMDKNFPG